MTVKDILKIIDQRISVQIKEGKYFVDRGFPAVLLNTKNRTDKEKKRLQKEVIGISGTVCFSLNDISEKCADIILEIE